VRPRGAHARRGDPGRRPPASLPELRVERDDPGLQVLHTDVTRAVPAAPGVPVAPAGWERPAGDSGEYLVVCEELPPPRDPAARVWLQPTDRPVHPRRVTPSSASAPQSASAPVRVPAQSRRAASPRRELPPPVPTVWARRASRARRPRPSPFGDLDRNWWISMVVSVGAVLVVLLWGALH